MSDGAGVACPACGHSTPRRRQWATRDFLRCRTCAVLFRHPQPSDAELEQAYRTHYYCGGAAPAVYPNTPPEIGEQVMRCLAPQGRVLDFGSGVGDFAAAAMGAGLDVDAVETDGLARAAAQRRGIRTYGSLEEIPGARRSAGYHLIALLDVLEHVRDPAAVLRELRAVLREDGRLYLSVPNYRAPQARLLGSRWDQAANPTHLFLFSPAALARLLHAAGFDARPFRCVIVDPRLGAVGRLISLVLQRLRLSATLRVVAGVP